MKRLLAFVLLICTTVLSLSGCRLLQGSKPKLSIGDYSAFGRDPFRLSGLNAKVESDSELFLVNEVTLDFYYSLYSLKNGRSLQEEKENSRFDKIPEMHTYDCYSWEYVYAIYLSSEDRLLFEMEDDGKTLVDYQTAVNAQLYKYISYEEAFGTNHGFTEDEWINIVYNHSEKLTIPQNYFSESSGCIYIFVVRFCHNLEMDKYEYDDFYRECVIPIRYELQGEGKVRLFED